MSTVLHGAFNADRMNGSIISLRDVLEGFVVVLLVLRAERWDEPRRNVLEVGLGVIGAAPPGKNVRIRGQNGRRSNESY